MFNGEGGGAMGSEMEFTRRYLESEMVKISSCSGTIIFGEVSSSTGDADCSPIKYQVTTTA